MIEIDIKDDNIKKFFGNELYYNKFKSQKRDNYTVLENSSYIQNKYLFIYENCVIFSYSIPEPLKDYNSNFFILFASISLKQVENCYLDGHFVKKRLIDVYSFNNYKNNHFNYDDIPELSSAEQFFIIKDAKNELTKAIPCNIDPSFIPFSSCISEDNAIFTYLFYDKEDQIKIVHIDNDL